MKSTIDAKGLPTGIYDSSIHGSDIPADAVDISRDDWLAHQRGDFRQFVDGAWRPYTPPFDVSAARRLKAAEIDAAYAGSIQQITAQYPASERESWMKQEAEARAWVADSTVPTPFLSALIKARGVPGETMATLANKIISNADAFAAAAAAAIGRRQMLMPKIATAKTQAALNKINW